MARQVTVRAREGRSRPGADRRIGAIERAGRRADEVVQLLASAGYEVRVRKIVPDGPEAKLTLEVTFGLEPSLFRLEGARSR